MPKKLRNCLRNKSENSTLKRTSMNYKAVYSRALTQIGSKCTCIEGQKHEIRKQGETQLRYVLKSNFSESVAN